jgi:acyl dehydratase/NAD(P)-dependent dehydrogenase (short-subunit alcohol dehydrogenase family)
MDAADPTLLATKSFSTADQELFARFSGDRNPMHMDPMAARRTQMGAPVVHGMHLVLWCLDRIASQPSFAARPSGVQARFQKPVYVGETACIRLGRRTDQDVTARIEVAGTLAASVRISFVERAEPAAPARANSNSSEAPALAGSPRELRFGDLAGRSGAVGCAATASDTAKHFPAATAWLGTDRVLGLATLSYLVGMECPGLHSIFGTATVELAPSSGAPVIDYTVTTADERVNLVRMSINGAGLTGTVEAFARLPPVAQMTMAAVSKYVSRGEFAGQRALIVGGSRGLGEITAKVTAAGGGHPIITYARGVADAEALQREIVDFGASCDVLRYDATQPAASQLTALREPPTQLYYYATGQIFRRKREVFQEDLFREFCAIYVSGFYNLCASLSPPDGGALAIFYPSSVAVEQRPRDLAEYAMAKAAGEILCAELARSMPGRRVVVKRLPRILTDQTASVLPAKSASAIEVLLPIIREMRGR